MGKARFMAGNLIDSYPVLVGLSAVGSVGLASKVGTGSAAMTTGGTFSSSYPMRQFYVEVNDLALGAAIGQAKFRWKYVDGAGWNGTGVLTDTDPITLVGSTTICWTSGGGTDFVAGDNWTFVGYQPFSADYLFDGDRDTEWRSDSIATTRNLLINLAAPAQVNALAIVDHNLTDAATIVLTGWNGSDYNPLGPFPVTHANARLSLVNGTAFVDFIGENLAQYAGRQITITCVTGGKTLVGWIKAAGTGETLSGTELVQNPGFESAGGGAPDLWLNWNEQTLDGALADETTIKHGGSHSAKVTTGATTSRASCRIQGPITATPGRINKVSFWSYGDGTNYPAYDVFDATHAAYITAARTPVASKAASWAQTSAYFTVPSGCTSVYIILYAGPANGAVAYFDDVSCQQVTIPSLTGGTIVSAQWGTTYNWTSEEAGFNRNDASGYTYTIGAAPTMTVPWSAGNLVYYPTQEARTCQNWNLAITDAANPDGYLRASEIYLGPYTELTGSFRPNYVRTSRADVYGPSAGGRVPRGVLATSDALMLTYLIKSQADRTAFKAIFDAVYDASRGTVLPVLVNLDSADPSDVSLYVWTNPQQPFTARTPTQHDWTVSLSQVPRLAR